MAEKFQLMKNGLNMDGNRIINLEKPINGGDAVNLDYFNETLSQSSFQDEVVALQKDATLVPTQTTDPRSRYVITDRTKLNAAFGVITGVGDGDIVEWDGSKFNVVFDASEFTLDFTIAYVSSEDKFYQYTKSDNMWSPASGLNDLSIGEGLVKDNDVLTIDKTIVVTKKEFTIGNGVDTDYVLVHNLNNQNPTVTAKEVATNAVVAIAVENTSINSTTIKAGFPLEINELLITISG